MYKIDINHPYNINGVTLINIEEELKKRIDYQLAPLITETDGVETHYVYAIKGNENKYKLSHDTLFVTYKDDIYLTTTLRKAVRDILFDPFLQSGYTKMHSSSVKKDDDVYVILGDKRAGKTSTALGLCKYEGFSFIGGDLCLIKDDELIGWPTSIGVRSKTFEILGLRESAKEYYRNKEHFWMWPKDYEKLGYSFAAGGQIKRCIFHQYDFDGKNEERICTIDEFRRKMIDNIHYDEINKDNYWNTKPVDIEICRENIGNNSMLTDCSNAINVTSTGLTEENIKRLVRIMR
jgi:hypothetical protein